ncbi:serine hydrolase [Phytomonospora sp. NPDC050363]|uniref:serine hydrolase n=1 Tax=Phytomonospora sp. NPDC050363 TaxID=3155642 RepID=UPI0034099712
MSPKINRRGALGFGTAVAAGTVLAGGSAVAAATGASALEAGETAEEISPATSVSQACERVRRIYERHSAVAGGTWRAHITVADSAGNQHVAVSDESDTVVDALSVNKIAIATAVLDKADRGLIAMTDLIDVTQEIIIPGGDGMFRFDGWYPSHVTVGHALANLLTISCDTSVRLSGLKAPTLEINEIMVAKGFPKTQVEPGSNPNRMFMGWTTPREMHDLFSAHIRGQLLSETATTFLFNLLRSPIAFTDGIRLNLSTNDRMRIATKAGWLDNDRHEAGIVFDAAGAPILTYSIFATLPDSDPENYGSTHPLNAARARMGERFFNVVSRLSGPARFAEAAPEYQPTNGG